MRSSPWFAALCALCVLAQGCSGGTGRRTIKLSHITSNTSHWHVGGERFAQLVGERLPGAYTVTVFPGGQIADHNQRTELQMLQGGSIEMMFVSPIILALLLDPRFDAFSTPWLFEDNASARRACTGELAGLAASWLRERNIELLAVGVNGFRQLTNSVREIRAPEDMTGIKFRVAGTDLFLETFKSLGANPITMNFGEVFAMLKEGAIDGQENPLAIISTSRLYEVQKHLTLWNYAFDPIFLVANGSFYRSLPEPDRRVLRECAVEAMRDQWDHSEGLERDLLRDLAGNGMSVSALTPEEIARFRRAAEPAYDLLARKLGGDVLAGFRRAALGVSE